DLWSLLDLHLTHTIQSKDMAGAKDSTDYFSYVTNNTNTEEDLHWDDDYVEWDEKYQLPPPEKPITSPKAQRVWVAINSVIDILFIKTLL
ncbi:hypothetical protein K7432_018367, partial [Basidiobolus ranarum]